MKRTFLVCLILVFAVSLFTGCQINVSKEFGIEAEGSAELTDNTQTNDEAAAAGQDEEIKPDTDENDLSEQPEETELSGEIQEETSGNSAEETSKDDGVPADENLGDGSQEDQEDPASSEQGDQPVQDQVAEGQSDEDQPAEDQPTQDQAAQNQPRAGDVIGTWISGAVTASYNSGSGKFEDVSGMGILYEFHENGTFAQLIVFGNYMVTTGKYSISDGVLTLTERIYTESSDGGQTWSAQEVLPDASCYFEAGADDSGKYLMLGQEGENPPLEDKVNAMKFKAK